MILDDVSFSVNEGEIVGVLGRNGSGKTTLLNLMTGFLKVNSGEILIKNQNIENLSLGECAKTISYIQQSKQKIPSFYIVEDFVLEGRRPFRKFGFYTKEDYELLDTVLKQCKLEDFRERNVSELSGGELQRCIFAKALMKQCNFFIFDEPTSAMDIKYQKEFFELATIAKKELSAGILLSIHDINLAIRYCDTLIVLDSAKIVYNGKAKKITKDILSKAFDTRISDKCSEELHFYY